MMAPSFQFQQTVELEDVIPLQGPDNTTAVPTIPVDALALTETVDTIAVDFVDNNTSSTKAVVLGIETTERPHDHDYAVCNSYHGYSIDNVAPIPFPDLLPGVTEENPPWFWYVLTQKDELLEEALTFVVFVNEAQKTFVVDSKWLVDYYPEQFGFDFDYIFNFQIWALSSEETYKLLQRIIENLATLEDSGWTVSFANTVEPSPPTVLIRQAEYHDNEAQLTVQSWLTDSQIVTFYGSWRSYDNWDTSIGFNYEAEVPPGTSTVRLPFESLLDAVIVSNVDGFLSKVYVGSGFWFVFSDEQSAVTMIPGQCFPIANANNNELILAGCVEMTGTITTTYGYVGLARTLNPNGVPVDVSQYGALTFLAKGDGKSYRINIETASVEDYDYPQFVFTAPTEWRQLVIPLSLFEQRGWGQPVHFTRTDVRSVAWLSVGAPIDGSVNLAIDKVAFTNSTIISNTTILSNTNDVVSPYTVTAEISDDVGIETASLYYSVDDGNSFTPVIMTGNSGTFSGQIPGQPLNTEVRYYIEATDADGNVATDPVDIPCTTYRFQVSENPFLLVDDFCDTNPANVLGGDSGMFDNPEAGGTIAAYYDKESLRLDYDVLGTDKYAGYYTRLNQADLTRYSAVTFLVKGASGGEKAKIGLRDSLDNEPKIVLSEYLRTGVTTSWQKVTIPLVAFTRVLDWSSMESFVVAFENRIGSGVGTIYLDDIKFEHIPAVPVVVDNFNDMTGENGLGGSLWTSTGGGAAINTAYDPANAYGDSGAGYRVSYGGVTGTAWAAAGSDLMDLDASGYEILSFYIKGASGGEKPNIYLADNVIRKFVNIEDYVSVTTFWQWVRIPLEDFAALGVNITDSSYFQVVFEWEEMEGTIYLDDIQFSNTLRIFLPIVMSR
jgi:hypothetical protein